MQVYNRNKLYVNRYVYIWKAKYEYHTISLQADNCQRFTVHFAGISHIRQRGCWIHAADCCQQLSVRQDNSKISEAHSSLCERPAFCSPTWGQQRWLAEQLPYTINTYIYIHVIYIYIHVMYIYIYTCYVYIYIYMLCVYIYIYIHVCPSVHPAVRPSVCIWICRNDFPQWNPHFWGFPS